MKLYEVDDRFYGTTDYMTQEEIKDYAEDLADKMEEEDEYGERPSTVTFDDCVNVLESANAFVYESQTK